MTSRIKKIGVSMLIASGIAAGTAFSAGEAAAAQWPTPFNSAQECENFIFYQHFPGKNSYCKWIAPTNKWYVFYDA